MAENVVRYSDVNPDGSPGRTVLLDTNGGYVYDPRTGNQLERWTPTSQEFSGMLADYASEALLHTLSDANRSAICFDAGDAEEARDRSKRILSSGWGGDRVVKMTQDLTPADVHQAAPLPNYAAGYRNGMPIADMFAPPLLVNKSTDKYYEAKKEDAFQRVIPSVGASTAAVAEVNARILNSTFQTVQYALGGFVSTEVESNADSPLRPRQATMRRVINALLIEREIRVATLATTSGTWDSTVVATLAAAAKWNGGASSDPILDLQTRLETSWGDVTGIIMSERTYNDFSRNPAVQKFFAYKSSAAPIPDAAQASALLRLPPIYVGRMKAIGAATGTLDYIWGNDVVLVRQPSEMPPTSMDDIASAVTFRWNQATGPDGVASNGMIVREFFVQDRGAQGGNKVVLVHHDIETQTSKFVGGLIKAAHA